LEVDQTSTTSFLSCFHPSRITFWVRDVRLRCRCLVRHQVVGDRVRARALIDSQLDAGSQIQPDGKEEAAAGQNRRLSRSMRSRRTACCPVSQLPLMVVRQVIFASPGLKQNFRQSAYLISRANRCPRGPISGRPPQLQTWVGVAWKLLVDRKAAVGPAATPECREDNRQDRTQQEVGAQFAEHVAVIIRLLQASWISIPFPETRLTSGVHIGRDSAEPIKKCPSLPKGGSM